MSNPDTGQWQLENLTLADPQPLEYLRQAAGKQFAVTRQQRDTGVTNVGISRSNESGTERGFESTGAVGETTFTITNQTQGPLTVHWLDYQGLRQKWFELRPA